MVPVGHEVLAGESAGNPLAMDCQDTSTLGVV